MGTRKQFMQHIMRILARMSLQGVARKLEAERLQRLLPTAQRQPGAVDQRPLDVKNHQPTTNSHGNRLGRRQLRHHRTRRLLHPAYLDNAAASLEFPQLCRQTDLSARVFGLTRPEAARRKASRLRNVESVRLAIEA